MSLPFIPYFIDYTVKNQSKTIGVSKKRVTFKFGFANRQAVDDGLVGAHCRGSEHEVVFVWSLNSGKRHVMLDGKDVHFSSSGQNGWTSDRTWQHVFSLKVPNYSGTFRCHLISQPAPQGSNVRPFDLRVGGVSIFKFNQIYQLGTPQMTVRKPGGSRASYNGSGEQDEPMTAEERRLLAAARLESLKEFEKQQHRSGDSGFPGSDDSPAGNGTADLLSFDAPTPAPTQVPQGMPNQMVSSMTLGSEFGLPPQQQQQQQPPYGYPQQQQHQQPNYGGGYSAPQAQGGYGSPPGQSTFSGSTSTYPAGNTSAMTPYQGSQASIPGYSLGNNSFAGGASTNFFGAVSADQPPQQQQSFVPSTDPYGQPPADPFSTAPPPQQTSYQPPAPAPFQQQQGYAGGGYPQQQQPLQSPTGTQASFGTYGSAPTFARPPHQQQQQQQQQQQPNYGQQQQNPYGAPPQYQQQQYQQPGF